MVSIPLSGGLLTSPIAIIAVIVIIVGTVVGIVALSHSKENVAKAFKKYFFGTPVAQSAGQDEEEEETTGIAGKRREINEFDLTIFDEK